MGGNMWSLFHFIPCLMSACGAVPFDKWPRVGALPQEIVVSPTTPTEDDAEDAEGDGIDEDE